MQHSKEGFRVRDMLFNATFNNSYIVTVSFMGGENRGTLRKPVIDKRYHQMVYRVHIATSGIRTHNLNGVRYLLHR